MTLVIFVTYMAYSTESWLGEFKVDWVEAHRISQMMPNIHLSKERNSAIQR